MYLVVFSLISFLAFCFFVIVNVTVTVSAMDHSLSDWHTTDIMVKIKETHDNTELIHQTGVIRGISVSVCTCVCVCLLVSMCGCVCMSLCMCVCVCVCICWEAYISMCISLCMFREGCAQCTPQWKTSW